MKHAHNGCRPHERCLMSASARHPGYPENQNNYRVGQCLLEIESNAVQRELGTHADETTPMKAPQPQALAQLCMHRLGNLHPTSVDLARPRVLEHQRHRFFVLLAHVPLDAAPSATLGATRAPRTLGTGWSPIAPVAPPVAILALIRIREPLVGRTLVSVT